MSFVLQVARVSLGLLGKFVSLWAGDTLGLYVHQASTESAGYVQKEPNI